MIENNNTGETTAPVPGDSKVEERKADHIRLCADEDVNASWNYWNDIQLVHSALPSVDMKDISLSTELFGKKLEAPLVISAITGGHSMAKTINANLASAAEEHGIAMGVGSQRAGIEHPDLAYSYSVIKDFDVPLVIGNLGVPQFVDTNRTYGLKEAQTAMEMVDADILALHLNYLQEAVQPEGDTDAAGLMEAIASISSQIPVIAKETGAGLTRQNAISLQKAGVKGIDVGGLGGTSFSAVEVYRARAIGDQHREQLGELLWDWGIPTPVAVKEALVGLPVIATGGIRSGLDVVRSIVLGASAAGMAGRLLKPAMKGPEEASAVLKDIIGEIRAVLFLCGVASVEEASKAPWFTYEPSKTWFQSLGHVPGSAPGLR